MRARRIAVFAATAAVVLGGSAAVAAPASASTRLSGVDMQAACNNQYPGQGRIARVTTNSAFGWKCVTGSVPVAPGDINTGRQCQAQFPSRPTVFATYTNVNDPFSWGCYV